MRRELDPQRIRKVVILRTDRIGEVVLSTPVIDAVKIRFPDAKITFVTSPYAQDVVAGRKDLSEVMLFSTIAGRVSLKKALALSRGLKSRGFDLAIVLNPHKLLHLAVFLAGIPVRAGFARKWGFLLNRTMKDRRHEGKVHEVDYNLALLETIGIKERGIAPYIDISDQDRDFIEVLYGKYNIDWKNKIVIVHTGSSNPAKKWPVANFTELIRRLVSTADLNIVLVGDKTERPDCEAIVSEIGRNRISNLAGLLTVGQLASLLKWSDLMITNDNGPMHIAAAVGKKVIAIFGRNIPGVSPARWGPYGKGHIVFYKDPGCSPCHDRNCPYDFKCLKAITPEEVFGAARKALK